MTAAQQAAADGAARLVAELGSDNYETRERAGRELEALGAAIRPALQKALASSDPEVRRLARDLAEKVARKLETAEVLEPKRFRLAFRDVPLHVAVQEFTRITGAQLLLEGVKANDKKITLDTGYTGFWDAFDKFCLAAGLSEKTFDSPAANTPDAAGGYQAMWGRRRMAMWNGMGMQQQAEIIPALPNGQFVLTEAKSPARPYFQAGALRFRAVPAGVTLGHHSTLKGDNELVFGLEVIPSPSLAWERVQTLRIDRAIDDKGQNLVASQADAGNDAPANDWDNMGFYPGDLYGNGGTNNTGQRVPLRLTLGRKPSTVLKELSGVATVKMQTATQPIATIDNILTARDKSAKGADGSFLKVVEVKAEEGGRLVLQIKVDQAQQEGANFNPWGWRNMMWRGQQDGSDVDNSVSTGSLVLFDARGHLVRLVAKEPIPDDNGLLEEYRFVYQLVKGQPDPTKLVLQGRRAVTIDVPFTLKDVSLKAAPGTSKPAAPPPPSQQPQSEISVDW